MCIVLCLQLIVKCSLCVDSHIAKKERQMPLLFVMLFDDWTYLSLYEYIIAQRHPAFNVTVCLLFVILFGIGSSVILCTVVILLRLRLLQAAVKHEVLAGIYIRNVEGALQRNPKKFIPLYRDVLESFRA